MNEFINQILETHSAGLLTNKQVNALFSELEFPGQFGKPEFYEQIAAESLGG